MFSDKLSDKFSDMFTKENFRKKLLLPTAYCAVLGLAIWSGNALIPTHSIHPSFTTIEPAAGEEATTPNLKVSQDDLQAAEELPALTAEDAAEIPPLRISPDKPEIIKLDRDAVNVLVGSEQTLRAVPDTNRTIILIPKQPGATFVKVTDADGKIIMQRHVIVGAPEKSSKYIRIRRVCAEDAKNCKQFSVYYCPDICHEVNVVQNEAASSALSEAPADAPSPQNATGETEYIEPIEQDQTN